MKKPPPIISFVGLHDSGKTTLLAKLIPLLRERGLRIGVVKHTHHHDFEIDRPGKDSYRLKQAGAERVMIASDRKIAFVADNHRRQRSWRELLPCFQDLDLLLVEGDKHSSLPKIEVYRKSMQCFPLYPKLRRVIAICTDVPLATKRPQFRFRDVRAISDFVAERIHKK